jgi:hypothetical protein
MSSEGHTRDQKLLDAESKINHGRIPALRPGDTVNVCGNMARVPGKSVPANVINSRIRADGVEEVLAATREYGRRWFCDGAGSFRVVEG